MAWQERGGGVFERGLHTMAYVINLDEYKSIGTHWIALYVDYTNSFFCNDYEKNDEIILKYFQ